MDFSRGEIARMAASCLSSRLRRKRVFLIALRGVLTTRASGDARGVSEMAGRRLCGILHGHGNLNDHDDLRKCPALGSMLDQLLVDMFVERHKEPPKQIAADFDVITTFCCTAFGSICIVTAIAANFR